MLSRGDIYYALVDVNDCRIGDKKSATMKAVHVYAIHVHLAKTQCYVLCVGVYDALGFIKDFYCRFNSVFVRSDESLSLMTYDNCLIFFLSTCDRLPLS